MVPEEIAALPPFPGLQSRSPGEREREYPGIGNVPLSFDGIFWREVWVPILAGFSWKCAREWWILVTSCYRWDHHRYIPTWNKEPRLVEYWQPFIAVRSYVEYIHIFMGTCTYNTWMYGYEPSLVWKVKEFKINLLKVNLSLFWTKCVWFGSKTWNKVQHLTIEEDIIESRQNWKSARSSFHFHKDCS